MAIDDLIKGIDSVANSLSGSSKQIISGNSFEGEGFSVAYTPTPDGTGLPSSKLPYAKRNAKEVRKIVHWFVPEFGVIRMYVNPQNINYQFNKLISKQLTKGGHVVQYWGENLTTLTIDGTTGSSGIEGINVLYELYRAEQYAFDSIGLTLAANSNVSGVGGLLGDAIGGALGDVAGAIGGGLLGADPGTGNILPQQLPSLASLACGVEMFWDGWVFRGFFENFSFRESADSLGLYTYNMSFVVTQRRGYRDNNMPWHHPATQGPSNNRVGGIPMTFGARGR